MHRCDLPHELVPRDFDDNLRFRREMRAWVEEEGVVAQDLLAEWCRRDVLFFADALVWTLNPKLHPGAPLRPWITLPFQEQAFWGIEEAFGAAGSVAGEDDQAGHDLCFVKSRETGCSYIMLICVDRRFLLYDYQVFVVVSSSEELVDKKANPNSLFPKLDIIHSRLPEFMVKGVERNKLLFSRPDKMCVIDGMATTGDVSRSGRPHAVIPDEFAAWPVNASLDFQAASIGATNCRLFISTPGGMGNGFHQVATNPDIPRIDLDWKDHPWQREGLYRSQGPGGTVEYLDKEFWEKTHFSWLRRRYPLLSRRIKDVAGDPLLRDVYQFNKDSRHRSPYYDNFCVRAKFPWIVSQELDRDFVGSGSPFYKHDDIQHYMDEHCRVPFRQGFLGKDPFSFEPGVFEEKEDGPLELWVNLVMKGDRLVPPAKRYQMGADVGAGTGASDSAVSVWDLVLREKVASYVACNERPERFAETAYCLWLWFGKPPIIAEGQGHGQSFHGRLKELGVGAKLFYMERKTVGGKWVRSEQPGLFIEGSAKESLLVQYGRALVDGLAVCRDRKAVKEALEFQLNKDGKAEHIATLSAKNPGGSKKNHGDRWMADCLTWYKVSRFKNNSVDKHEIERDSSAEPSPERQMAMRAEEDRKLARTRW